MYHNVTPDDHAYPDLSPSATSYFVTRRTFAEQLAQIRVCGGSVMTWDDLKQFYDPAPPAAPRPADSPVFITFDDGWRDSVEIGGSTLQEHGCSAIVFVTTGFLDRPHFLSRQELARLDADVFRVGSHAKTHRMLSLLDDTEIRAELSDSRKCLEDATGREVDAISIPSGAVDRRVRRIAAECGYRFLFDSEVRVNRRGDSPMAIARVALMNTTPLSTFRRYVTQRITRERVRRAVLQAPKRLLGLRRYERLRRRLLGEQRGQRVTHES
ncbi:MAG TPA: polysaccharide deacetylase family protein [Tepidisphaeraceae bacterium]|jgi:peptidoglycan/xylan/chitin deacetylase (PgdA/CDA1 family)